MALRLRVQVENTYSDGHQSERVQEIQVEPFDDSRSCGSCCGSSRAMVMALVEAWTLCTP